MICTFLRLSFFRNLIGHLIYIMCPFFLVSYRRKSKSLHSTQTLVALFQPDMATPHCLRSTLTDLASRSNFQNLHTLQLMSGSRLSPLCGKRTTFLEKATPRNPASSKNPAFPFLASSEKVPYFS